jgi:hypothetical protein
MCGETLSRKQPLNKRKKSVVIPAKAGIHVDLVPLIKKAKWIPAFAGMTTYPVLL